MIAFQKQPIFLWNREVNWEASSSQHLVAFTHLANENQTLVILS